MGYVANYTEGLANFLLYSKKLANIKRWNAEFLYKKASVAEHCFYVAQIAQLLGFIEEKDGATIDWAKLYRKALNHDIKESCTGDILHNTKHKKPEVNNALKIIETELSQEYILNKIHNEYYRNKIFDIINEDKDDTLEGKLLAVADILDAMLECLFEIKLGNTVPFQDKYDYLEGMLWSREFNNLKSVTVFIDNILPEIKEQMISYKENIERKNIE